MGRFVWNKWKQSCHQTFESPEEAVLFAVSCCKRLLNMSLSARALSMAVLPDKSPRVQCDDRWTQQANTSRKHDTRCPVLFLHYGHRKLPTLRQRIKTVQNSNASRLQKTPVTTFRTAKIVIVMYTWVLKKLTDTVLMQTRDDYRWRAAMRMFSSGPTHEIIRTVQKNIKNQSNLGTRHCSLVTAGKPPQTQKPANEVLTCKPREPHLVFKGSWITPGEGPAWTNWCARVKRSNEVKSRETFSAQVPATANTLPFIVGFSDLRRTALPFQCKRVANAGATVGQSAINDVEADPGLLSVSSWSRATQKTKGSSKSNALEKPKVVRQFSKPGSQYIAGRARETRWFHQPPP